MLLFFLPKVRLIVSIISLLSSCMLLLVESQQASSLSPYCISAISAYVGNQPCSLTLLSTLQNSTSMDICLQSGQNQQGSGPIDCFNVYDVIVAAAGPSKTLIRPYQLPSTTSNCAFCDANIYSSCQSLLASITSLASGTAAFSIGTNAAAVAANCSAPQEFEKLTALRYQSQILCDATNSYNFSITSANTLNNAMDMRSSLQCGQCSMIPCILGQYCGKNEKAVMCPRGSYCPDPATKLSCPTGYYCPLGTTTPVKCRGIAAGSCNGGADREVVWVPLFIALFLLFVVSWLSLFPPSVLQEMIGHLQTMKSTQTGPHKKFQPIQTSDVDQRNPNYSSAPRVNISFEDLLLISGTNTRLNHLSGSIRAGKFTAIIGGSGAGKTSLMNVLLARERPNEGKVIFSRDGTNEALAPHVLERIVSFVPQTDVLLAEMTVYQLLKHSAMMRLPNTSSSDGVSRSIMIEQKIDAILEKLEIQHLRHVIAKRSTADNDILSPGDKKKVSIGIELIAEPRICFLDEPTSGIDASSALSVVRIVRNMASSGVTCVAVVHQPRGEIFSLIDDIVIMVPGGKLAYQGPADRALAWFAAQSCPLRNPKANKTDFILDTLSGKYNPYHGLTTQALVTTDAVISTSNTINQLDTTAANDVLSNQDWAELWSSKGAAFLAEVIRDDSIKPSNESPLDISRPNVLFLCGLFLYRGLLQRMKAMNLVVVSINALIAGSIIGIVTSSLSLLLPTLPPTYGSSCPPGAEYLCNSWLEFGIGPATFLVTMMMGAVSVAIAVTSFGREKEYLAREAAVGSNLSAYYIGKVIADMVVLLLAAFMFTSALLSIGMWTAPFDLMLLVVFSVAVTFSAVAYMLSLAMTDADNATLLGVILCILLNLFGGFVPKLGDDPVGMIFLTHYSARAIATVELQEGMGLTTDQYDSMVTPPWYHPDWGTDILALWLFALGFHLVSYGLLRWKNPRTYRVN